MWVWLRKEDLLSSPFCNCLWADPLLLSAVSTLCCHYHTAALVAFVIYFKMIGMCSVLLCHHVDELVSCSEGGGQSVDAKYWKFLHVVFCLFTVWVQGKGTHHHDLGPMWCLHGASDALQKVSFKNKLSFHFPWFYIHFNWPLRKVKY
jgi:hypothetical protein